MPVQLKDPSVEEERLKFAKTDSATLELEEILHEPKSYESVAKVFAPKSYAAKNEFETRKEKQRIHREWLANIALRRNELVLNQQRITEMVNKSRNSNSNGGVGL